MPGVAQLTLVHRTGDKRTVHVEVHSGAPGACAHAGDLVLSEEGWEMLVTAMVSAHPGRVHVVEADTLPVARGDVIDVASTVRDGPEIGSTEWYDTYEQRKHADDIG